MTFEEAISAFRSNLHNITDASLKEYSIGKGECDWRIRREVKVMVAEEVARRSGK